MNFREYKEAIKTGEFSDEYNLTNKDLEKFSPYSLLKQRVKMSITTILFMIHMIFSINL